jgi:NAD(P)-dependent dehydrogenase (short-subunit alcohol dehydrogenase family)
MQMEVEAPRRHLSARLGVAEGADQCPQLICELAANAPRPTVTREDEGGEQLRTELGMELHLSGKVAVVTGASKGIGLAVTQALADEGVSVVVAARELTDELSQLAASFPVHPVLADLTTLEGPARLIEAAVSTFGGLDILVNNVGALRPRTGGFLSVTDDDWTWALTINFLAAVRTTRAAVPRLLERGGGTIVTMSSVNAFLPDPSIIDYCAAKAALTNFCKALSKEVGPKGIRVNTVSPGPVATALWLGEDGVAATVARAGGGEPDAVAKQAQPRR